MPRGPRVYLEVKETKLINHLVLKINKKWIYSFIFMSNNKHIFYFMKCQKMYLQVDLCVTVGLP